jgi:gliding motility-associated-like protein
LDTDELSVECITDSTIIKDLLGGDMYIDNPEDIACPGEKTIYVRHFNCEDWLDSIALTVSIDEDCYDFMIRDSICKGASLMIDSDLNLNLEIGNEIPVSTGIITPLYFRDIRCPEVVIEREAFLFECKECQYAIPNVFSPNGDGVNDVFDINLNCSIIRFEAEIYDRWGNLLHFSNQPEQIWNGGEAHNGTYVYRIEMEVFNGRITETIQEHGTITLVR